MFYDLYSNSFWSSIIFHVNIRLNEICFLDVLGNYIQVWYVVGSINEFFIKK